MRVLERGTATVMEQYRGGWASCLVMFRCSREGCPYSDITIVSASIFCFVFFLVRHYFCTPGGMTLESSQLTLWPPPDKYAALPSVSSDCQPVRWWDQH